MTTTRILLRKPGSIWRSPAGRSYDNEDSLQTLLEEAPELLPWADTSGLVVAREVQIPLSGPVDLVAVSTSGQITIVECKLSANPEIRRHVIGQIFAYASGIAGMSYEEFDGAFAARTGTSLASMVGDRVPGSGAEWDGEQFRSVVTENLAAGKMGLLIVVDEITEELKRIVEFLNAHTVIDLPVLALELNLVRDEGVEILLPTIFGEEAARAKTKPRHRTDEAELFGAVLENAGPESSAALHRILDHARSVGANFYWGEGRQASVTAWYPVEGQSAAVWSCYVYSQSKRASFDVNFEYMVRRGVPLDKLDALITALEKIPGVAERYRDVRAAGFRKRPSLDMRSLFGDSTHVDVILEALENLLQGDQ